MEKSKKNSTKKTEVLESKVEKQEKLQKVKGVALKSQPTKKEEVKSSKAKVSEKGNVVKVRKKRAMPRTSPARRAAIRALNADKKVVKKTANKKIATVKKVKNIEKSQEKELEIRENLEKVLASNVIENNKSRKTEEIKPFALKGTNIVNKNSDTENTNKAISYDKVSNLNYNEKKLKVLYVASECQPFIATGGLGEVAGSLPKAIARAGNVDIRVVLPLYIAIKNNYRDKLEFITSFTAHLAWRQEYCGLFKLEKDGVIYYFVDNERYFKRERPYGYYDDGERFAYFCKAIVESLPIIDFFPDIIHCNDWHSALVPTYIKTGNWQDKRYYDIKNIYTIHNVEYQGIYAMESLQDLFGINEVFRNFVDYNGNINLTKGAIQYSDKITTVSDSYCDNLKEAYCSVGLHHIIKRNEYKLSGIINGIDYDVFNPSIDNIIYKQYDINSLEDKAINKLKWQQELGLPVNRDVPMLSIVSRLVSHKGLGLLMQVMEDILQRDIQFVVVGTGDQKYIDYFKYLQSKYPHKVRAMVDAYSYENGRKAYAASDIFLMPSKIEPCGISQMIASRYGAVPVVREVGGLKDTIKDFGCDGGGNGYTFADYNPMGLKSQINRAIDDFSDKAGWKEKMKTVMSVDFSWNKSALKYIDLYKSLV